MNLTKGTLLVIIGIVVFHPSILKAIIGMVESFLMAVAVASASLQIGFKGPDFSGSRRARMVRQEWSLIGTAIAAVVGAVVFAPVLAQYASALNSHTSVSTLNYAIGVVISAAISLAITVIFYKINISSAEELLRKAEV